MRISDVQCAKRQGYKPRLINKLLVSQSGDSLLFSNIENEKIKIIEDKNKFQQTIEFKKHFNLIL